MALTETTQARVLRGITLDDEQRMPFVSVSELPRVEAARPNLGGNDPLDAIRAAAWEEGLAEGRREGHAAGRAEGFEVGRAEGRAAGYEDGRAAAIADADAQVRAELESAFVALDAAARGFVDAETVSLASIESTVVDLALQIAEAVLERELVVATDPGRDALRRALALAPEHGAVLARLHPSDVESLGDLAELAPGRAIEVVADAGVGRGGAVVEVGAARIDARLDTALDRVKGALAR